jgi:hypothetical protein
MNGSPNARSGVRFLWAGLLAGLVAAVVNIIVYLVMINAGGYAWAFVVAFSILIASLLPNLLAAALYFILTRLTPRWAWPLLAVGVVLFVLVSVLPHLGIGPAPSPALAALPEGFDLVTVPLHVVFGLTAITVMPWLVTRP